MRLVRGSAAAAARVARDWELSRRAGDFAVNVLLTGANGFVGSRILARLRRQGLPTTVLLRPTASRRLIEGEGLLAGVDVRVGTVGEAAGLEAALEGVTHVIHCAGKTKALHRGEFEAVNVEGTRRLVEAVNRRRDTVAQFVQISSLAAGGPALPQAPSRESDPPAPVSEYGRSKLRGERVVLEECRVPCVILRPSGVYGPGDGDFLQLFQAVRWRICPAFGGGRQPLTLVYVDDLAEVAVACLGREVDAERVFNVAHPEVLTAGDLTRTVARRMGVRVFNLPLPNAVLTPLAVGGECVSRLTGRPGILSLDRRRELQAPGWVCDVTRLKEVLGLECRTPIEEGVARTLHWYRQHGWL